MNYTINIIDTTTDQLVTSIEKALSSGAVINWQGSDHKEAGYIPSQLELKVIAKKYVDGYFMPLFTGDETRFRTEVIDGNGNYIWQGFVLPDEYEEPYTNTPVVNITASDGIGRLKGKYLPEDYYNEEKSIIDIITQCLSLTGLNLLLRFAPAIENHQQKDYDKIYLKTDVFKNGKDKKKDAYTILEGLLKSMLCVYFQVDNYFNIEGLNIREKLVYTAKYYDLQGNYVYDREITRLAKSTNNIATPDITMQPPIGVLSVSHKRELFGLKEGLSSETNDGWTYQNTREETYNSSSSKEVKSYIYVSDWFGRGGFHAYAGSDNKVFFTTPSGQSIPQDQRIDTNYRPYIEEGKKYKLKFEFEIVPESNDEEVNKNYVKNGDWQNPFDYDILYYMYPKREFARVLGNGLASSNSKYFPFNFGTGDKQKITIEKQFIPISDGDFIFTIHPLNQNIGISKVYINELSLELIGDSEDELIEGNPVEGWTTKEEIDLDYSDDLNGLGNSFRLQKLDEPHNSSTITQTNNVIREFDYKGKHYVSVPLWIANVVDENRDSVTRPTSVDMNTFIPVSVREVIYNYNNSDEHVIVTEEPIYTGQIAVEVHDYGFVLENRGYWQEWSDSTFKIERSRYSQVVYDVMARIRNKELPSILNMTAKNNVKINDIITSEFNGVKSWVLPDCKWDLDRGFSEISMCKRYYAAEGQFSPVVELGDVVYTEDQNAYLTSESYDPDGFITNFMWEEVTFTGSVINAPTSENTLISMPLNVYHARFRLTVTDNDGNTGFDEVDVYRRADITASLNETYHGDEQYEQEKHFKLELSPDLPEGMAVTFSGILKLKYHMSYLMQSANMYAQLIHNGSIITQVINNYDYNTDAPDTVQVGENNNVKGTSIDVNFNYIKGDEIILKLYGRFEDNNQPYVVEMTGSVDVLNVAFTDGVGAIAGLPLHEEIYLHQIV